MASGDSLSANYMQVLGPYLPSPCPSCGHCPTCGQYRPSIYGNLPYSVPTCNPIYTLEILPYVTCSSNSSGTHE